MSLKQKNQIRALELQSRLLKRLGRTSAAEVVDDQLSSVREGRGEALSDTESPPSGVSEETESPRNDDTTVAFRRVEVVHGGHLGEPLPRYAEMLEGILRSSRVEDAHFRERQWFSSSNRYLSEHSSYVLADEKRLHEFISGDYRPLAVFMMPYENVQRQPEDKTPAPTHSRVGRPAGPPASKPRQASK